MNEFSKCHNFSVMKKLAQSSSFAVVSRFTLEVFWVARKALEYVAQSFAHVGHPSGSSNSMRHQTIHLQVLETNLGKGKKKTWIMLYYYSIPIGISEYILFNNLMKAVGYKKDKDNFWFRALEHLGGLIILSNIYKS